jgi:hypothetical protein
LKRHRSIFWLLLLLVQFLASGATCDRFSRNTETMAPAAFVDQPTLEDVIFAINANTNRVQSLQTESASVSTPGFPALRASIALQPPRRLRMQATFLGPELDVGSNPDVFWFWVKSNPDAAIYFARHDQFQGSAAQTILPIEPNWLIEAFGLVTLDPSAYHEGPVARGDGKVELRSRIGKSGEYLRTIVVDDRYGWVVEQYVSDTNGQPLASAKASHHRFYPDVGVSLPHHIEVDFPPAAAQFSIDIGQYTVNHLTGDPNRLWNMPQLEGYQLLNLAQTSRPPAGSLWPEPSAAAPPTVYATSVPFEYRRQYRGYVPAR